MHLKINDNIDMKSRKLYKGLVYSLCALCIFASFFLISCGSTAGIEEATHGTVEDFTRKELSNGIPVIFKQNRGSKIVVMRVIFEGGTSSIDKSVSGLEGLTLDLALRGSDKYPYSNIQQLEYEKSFSLYSSSGKDYAVAGFTCIQRDMAEVLNIFSDCILNPSMSESDFSQKMTEAAEFIARNKSDPSGALGLAISKAAFADHPYETGSSIIEDSYPNINLTLVKGLQQSLLNALRIKIVVVGNFSNDLIENFTKELEDYFGSLPRKAFSLPKIPKISVPSGKVVKLANEQAGDTGYVAGLFECPSKTADDYIPFALVSMYLDDLYFSQVREKAGAVYSINTGIMGGKELLAVISAYRVSGKEHLKQLISDAILSFDANVFYKKLDQYKNRYISTIFNSSQTAAGLASSVISSLEYFDSESAYLQRADAVRAVDMQQIVAAYKKYFEPVAKENAAQWIIVDGKNNLAKYDF